MKKIKYGMIGFGGIAENRIAKEGFGLDGTRFNGNPDAELVGVLEINSDRKKAAEALNLKWYDNLEQLLDDEIEAIYVATNNSSHFSIAEKVIKTGKHCLIEKPVTTNLSDAGILQELARERKVSLDVDHMMRQNSFNINAREIINSNQIGTVNDITLHMEFSYGSTDEEASSWRCSRPEELGGPIGDVGSHCFYMAEFLLNDVVTEVSCVFTPGSYEIAVENGAVICFKTRTGCEGSILVSFNKNRGGLIGTLSNLGFEVYGSEGVVRSFGTLFQLSGHEDEPVKLRMEVETAEGVEKIIPDNIENIYQKQISHHVQSIRSGNYLDGEDAVHNLRLLFACFKSVEENSRFVKV